MDYNKTVNLPQTDFPMRAGLPRREPEMLQAMYDKDLYHKMVARNDGKPLFVLHDGPPYANGNIHIGTALNKILKDIIVKEKNMTGYCSPYVPGWDTHGLPTESAILKNKKVKRDALTTSEFREKCKEYALDFVDKQREQFKRLGVLGEWDDPYLTLKPYFEAKQVKVFGEMAKKGFIYKGMKPVYWCPHDQTALAEAEIEYADDPCTTIFVKFPVRDDKGMLAQYCDLSKLFFHALDHPGQYGHLPQRRAGLCAAGGSLRRSLCPGPGPGRGRMQGCGHRFRRLQGAGHPQGRRVRAHDRRSPAFRPGLRDPQR